MRGLADRIHCAVRPNLLHKRRVLVNMMPTSLLAFSMLWLGGCAQFPSTTTPMVVEARPANCGVTSAQSERVHVLNAELVKRGYAPGATVLILCDGVPLIRATDGMADVARRVPLREDNLFRIYSMTKPLTSVAAMILIEEKKLGLDDSVSKYLPAFADARVYVSGETVENMVLTAPQRALTVRDLLRHTAGMIYGSAAPDPINRLYALKGIDNGGGAKVLPADGSAPLASAAEFTSRLAAIPFRHQPGTRFSYGAATDVLGHVVEKASGVSLADFLERRIFAPLGMRDTFFQVPADKVDRLTAAYAGRSQVAAEGRLLPRASLDRLEKGAVNQIEDPQMSLFAKPRYMYFGGAGLVSTAADYQRFLQMMLNGGRADGVQILSLASVEAMTRNQLDAEAINGSSLASQGLGFGLGFATYLDPAKAPVAVPPRGYFWGGAASTYFWVDPDRRLSGVLMTQVFGGDVMSFYLEMLNALYASAAPQQAMQTSPPNSRGEPAQKPL